jgi:hypothetical protein
MDHPPGVNRRRIVWWALPVWLAASFGCLLGAYFLLLESEPHGEYWNDVRIETAIGGEVLLPADNPHLLRTPPTFTYYLDPEPYFEGAGSSPVIEVQLETLADTGTVRFAITHLRGSECELVTAPVNKRQLGSSVNYDAGAPTHSTIILNNYYEEERIDENTFRAIKRKWSGTLVELKVPNTRYLISCATTAVPDFESIVSRRIGFTGPNGAGLKRIGDIPKWNSWSPGADDSLAFVRFILNDAQDPSYEGAIAETPNSGPAHRFRLTFSNGSASVRWIDTAASRKHDLLLILAGAIVAFAATIVFELLKLALPMVRE